MQNSNLPFGDRLIAVDNEGFLLDPEDWCEGLAEKLAKQLELPLTAERFEVIRFIRTYYEQNMVVPEARKVLKHLQLIWGKDRATRKYLYRLFPYGYGQQACKIAGMRKPLKLMLDI